MEENLGVYSAEIVSREVYEGILRELGAQFNPDPVYNARITRDHRHAWFARYTQAEGEDPYGSLREESAQLAARSLGMAPRTAITIHMNREIGTINIAVDFVTLLAERYPCVVVHEFRETSTPDEFIRAAEPGYDGYRWDTASNAVAKGPLETSEEKSERFKRERREKVLGGGSGLFRSAVTFLLFTTVGISLEEFTRLMQKQGAEISAYAPLKAQLSRDELNVHFTLREGQVFRQYWDNLAESFRVRLTQALGEPAQSIIDIRTEQPLQSVNLALDFLLAFEQHYPCIVWDLGGELHKPTELLEFAQPGYDGYEWNADQTQIVKVQPEPPAPPQE